MHNSSLNTLYGASDATDRHSVHSLLRKWFPMQHTFSFRSSHQSQGPNWMDIASCLWCAVALADCFAAVGLGGQNKNRKWCSVNEALQFASASILSGLNVLLQWRLRRWRRSRCGGGVRGVIRSSFPPFLASRVHQPPTVSGNDSPKYSVVCNPVHRIWIYIFW